VDVTGSRTKQGGFLLVRYNDPDGAAAAPAAYYAATGYGMQKQGSIWYAFIGLSTYATLGSNPLEVWDGGTLLASGVVSVVEGGFTYLDFEVPPSSSDLLLDQARIAEENALVYSVQSVVTPTKYWTGAWGWPAVGNISSTFGEMRSANGGPYYPHTGTDIANEKGTPIYAAADGVVALNKALLLYGNSVIIDHGVGVFSSYSHMDSSLVTDGQFVHKGDVIGYMGETGYVTGPHLHWEAIIHNVLVNATLFVEGPTDP
jgi:murein DD-endopeptidase MepM/ murein hydrolase activator NlpD